VKFTFFLGYPGQTRQKAAGLPIRWNAKRPRGFPAGAIPTVDFLLHHASAFVKKMPVKSHDGAGKKLPPGQVACLAQRSQLAFSPTRNAKRPLGFPAGAIPTVGFLLHHASAVVKKKACQIL
jgi:hypothetical protein